MIVVDCEGDGRKCGHIHGETARQLVREALERWTEATVRRTGVPLEIYVSNLLSRTKFAAYMSKHTPDLLEEVRGIAEAATVSFETALAYNLMDEQWWHDLEGSPGDSGACSVVASPQTRLIAQNMDLPAFMNGSQLVLRIRRQGLPEALILTAAGLMGLTGINRMGIAICVNTLLMLQHSGGGLPVVAVLRGALQRTSLGSTIEFLQSVKHASGQHYAVGSTEGIMGLECSAAGVVISSPVDRPTLTHTNHPLASTDINAEIVEQPDQRGRVRDSEKRLAFLNEHVSSIVNISDAKRLLADRSIPVCVTPTADRQTQTFGSVIFELSSPPRANFCTELPTTGEWRQLEWNDTTP